MKSEWIKILTVFLPFRSALSFKESVKSSVFLKQGYPLPIIQKTKKALAEKVLITHVS